MILPKMMLVEKTCFLGCKVKTGALIISYIALIQAVAPILNILSHTAPEVDDDREVSNGYKRDLMWLCLATIVIVAHALWGIYKSKPRYMIPFMIYKLVILFILTVTLGFAPAIINKLKAALINASGSERNDMDDLLPLFIFILLLAIVVEAYCLLILFSHYQNALQATFAQQVQIPAVVRFSAGKPADPEAAITGPYIASKYSAEDLPMKKSSPPPYAV